MENESLFSQTYDQIVSGALSNAKYFQMIGTPKNFSWPTAPTGQMGHEAYQVISGMPMWSPVGGYAEADARFFNAYRSVLNHITFKVSPEREQDLKDLKDKETRAANEMTKATSDQNQAYLTEKQNGGLVFSAKYPDIIAWLENAPEAASWNEKIKKTTENFNNAQNLVLELEKASMPHTLQQATDAIKMPSGDPASSTAPRGWTKVPDSDGIIRWQPSWNIETSGSDWRAELTKGSIGAFTVKLDAQDSTSDLNKSWAGGSAGYDAFFWGVSGGGGWQKMDLTKSDKSVTATISVKSSTRVKVNPGDWYDGGFMSDVAKGSQGAEGEGYTIAKPWVAKGKTNSLFGQDGILKSRVSELFVVHKPSFKIEMSSSTYQQNYQKFEASGGFRIGPFSFGGSGGHESEYIHSTSGTNTFEGESTSDNPLIIGVIVAFPGGDAP